MIGPDPALRGGLAALVASLDEVLGLAGRHAILDGDAGGASAPAGGRNPATVAGQQPATVADYRDARDLVAGLVARFDELGHAEYERLELNGDLPQFAFHLDEELSAQRERFDGEALARSLTFLKRHIVRLRAEYVDHVHLALHPEERAVLTALARHVRHRYRTELAGRYEAIGYRRPYVDKFYRDYSLTGIPDGLVLRLADLAEADPYDRYLCVLKGGMSYTTMLAAFGIPAGRIVHVMAGRASGSHYEDGYLVDPVDFEPADLAGRSVLVVDNNLATGRTLAALTAWVAAQQPGRVGVLLDYVLSDVAGLHPDDLAEHCGYAFDSVICGPFAGHVPGESGRVGRLRAKLGAALAGPGPTGPEPVRAEGVPRVQ